MITNYIAAVRCAGRGIRSLTEASSTLPVQVCAGVIATASTIESCRAELAEVIEAWILVRVSRALNVPALGRTTVQVKRAS